MDGRSEELPVQITFHGLAQPCETTVSIVGPHVVVLETTVPVPGIALTVVSTYTGMRGAQTQVVHAGAGAGEMTWSSHRSAEEADLPVWRARQRCLFDHLAEVHGLLAAYGVSPAIDVGFALPFALRD